MNAAAVGPTELSDRPPRAPHPLAHDHRKAHHVTIHNQRDEPCDTAACPFRRDCPDCPDCRWKGGAGQGISAGQAPSTGRIGPGNDERPPAATGDRSSHSDSPERKEGVAPMVATSDRPDTPVRGDV